jgi:hypothetical protein
MGGAKRYPSLSETAMGFAKGSTHPTLALKLVMPGLAAFAKATAAWHRKSPSKPRRRRVPGIHVLAAFKQERRGWPGRSPAMTENESTSRPDHESLTLFAADRAV